MLAAQASEQVNWWAIALPAILGPIAATVLGVVVARKVARRTAREEVGRSRALEEYPGLMKQLAAMEKACKPGRFPPTNETVRYGSQRAREMAGVVDFSWWVRYGQEGRDVLLHKAVRDRLDRLEEVVEEYGRVQETAVELVREDLWPRISSDIPPSAHFAIEQVIAGEVERDYVDIAQSAIRASIQALGDDSRLSAARDARERLATEIELSRNEIRKTTEKYAP